MNRVWMITGAARGLGHAFAEEAVKNGDKVIATIRKINDTDPLMKNENVLPVIMDVTKKEDVIAAVDAGIRKFSRIDVLINNAGFGMSGAFEEVSDEELRTLMETNFFGVTNVTRAVLPTMRKQGGGMILTVSSQAAAMAFRLNGKVTIVEMLPNIFASLDFDKLITEYKIDVKTETKVTEIKEDCVVVEKDGVKNEIPATQVVLAFGYKPDNSLAEELKGLCDVKVIGGSVKTSNAVDATRDGFYAGMAV